MRGRRLNLNRKLLAFTISFVVVSGLAMSPLRHAVSRAGITTGNELLALFDARSPGARPEGALLTTKPAKAPREYAKPRVRERLPGGIAPVGPPLASASPLGAPIFPLSAINHVVPPLPFAGPPLLPPGAPVVLPPGGPPGPPVPPGTPPPSPAPVPEPSMWLTMIIGLGVTGLVLRRERKAQLSLRTVPVVPSIPAS